MGGVVNRVPQPHRPALKNSVIPWLDHGTQVISSFVIARRSRDNPVIFIQFFKSLFLPTQERHSSLFLLKKNSRHTSGGRHPLPRSVRSKKSINWGAGPICIVGKWEYATHYQTQPPS